MACEMIIAAKRLKKWIRMVSTADFSFVKKKMDRKWFRLLKKRCHMISFNKISKRVNENKTQRETAVYRVSGQNMQVIHHYRNDT